MEQLFFAGKAYLKINSLVKTPLHEFMAVERSGLWAPDRNNDFGVESLKSVKGQENLLLKNPALKTSDFCHGELFL